MPRNRQGDSNAVIWNTNLWVKTWIDDRNAFLWMIRSLANLPAAAVAVIGVPVIVSTVVYIADFLFLNPDA